MLGKKAQASDDGKLSTSGNFRARMRSRYRHRTRRLWNIGCAGYGAGKYGSSEHAAKYCSRSRRLADGSSWAPVIKNLQAAGYHVTAVQLPHTSLAADVDVLRHVLTLQTGSTIVAGHSFGGQVMTALGEDAPNMVGLAYIAAFGLDEGESIGGLLWQGGATPR